MRLTKLNQLIEEGTVLKGRWELTPNHEIQYKSEDLKEEIKLKGSLIAAEPDALVISVTERQADQKVVTSIAKLAGTWRLDSKNRIVFEVEKESGKNDILTFKGTWEIGKNHEIIYSYGELDTGRRVKERHKLVFKGYWDISQNHRLTYFIGGSSYSFFRLRGTFQTRSDLPQFSGRSVKIDLPVFRSQRGSDFRALNEPFCDCNTFPRIQRSFFLLHPGS